MCRCLDSTYPRMAPYVVLAELRNVNVWRVRTPHSASAAISAVERLPVAGPGRDPRGPAGPNPANPAATGGVRCSASVLRDDFSTSFMTRMVEYVRLTYVYQSCRVSQM